MSLMVILYQRKCNLSRATLLVNMKCDRLPRKGRAYMTQTETQSSIFEFSGNNLCLDFANTVHDRSSSPRELLNHYSDLLRWSREGHILTEDDAGKLLEEAASRPEE